MINKKLKILMFSSLLVLLSISSSLSSEPSLLMLSSSTQLSSSSSSSFQLTSSPLHSMAAVNNILDYERDALYDLYISTNGDHWKWKTTTTKGKWNFTNSNVNPCDQYNVWQGINCTNISSIYYITYLNLTEFNLVGTLPQSIGNFSMLTYIEMSLNFLTGTIPDTIEKLTYLSSIQIIKNKLSGNIPCYFFNKLQNLRFLILSDNHLTGTICNDIDDNNKSKLYAIQLVNNALTGTIPSNISNLIYLFSFYTSKNMLTGVLPSTLSKLQSFQTFYTDDNFITGTIPDSYGNIHNLTYFVINNNSITGTLPTTFNQLEYLDVLKLNHNKLHGKLTSCFDSTKQLSLKTIDLDNNQFTGLLPEELMKIQSLFSLSAVSNCFSGTISSNLCNSKNLVNIILDGLHTASTCKKYYFPTSLSSSYYLSDNAIGGTIPLCLFNMSKLAVLHLSGNKLTGTLPNHLNISKSLFDLSLSHNLLRGNIPITMQLKDWLRLDLSYNFFQGTLSSSLAASAFNYTLYHDKYFSSTTKQFKKYLKIYKNEIFYNLQLFGVLSTCNDTSSSSSEIECILQENGLTTYYALNQNRLSGHIPKIFLNLNKINILQGNSFSCNYNEDNLPKFDPYRNMYDCGSNKFDILFYIWLIFSLICIIIGLYSWYNYLKYSNNSSNTTTTTNHSTAEKSSSSSTTTTIPSSLYIIISKINHSIQAFMFSLPTIKIKNYMKNNNLNFRLNFYIIFFKLYKQLCYYALYATCYIIFILIPVYLILKIYYSTHTYQYAYNVSIMYISGSIPAEILFIILFIYLFLIRYNVLYYVHYNPYFNENNNKNDNDIDDILSRNDSLDVIDDNDDDDSFSRTITTTNLNNNSILTKDSNSTYINNRRTNSRNNSRTNSTTIILEKRNTVVNVSDNISNNDYYDYIRQSTISLFQRKSRKSSIMTVITYNIKQIIFLYTIIFLINSFVVIGINVLFVYISLYCNNTIIVMAQMLQSIFNIIWNFCLRYLINYFIHKIWKINIYSRQFDLHKIYSKVMLLLLFLMIFNTIIIPCFVVVIITPNCFYNIFISSTKITSFYIDRGCAIYTVDKKSCEIPFPLKTTTSYDPPFTYSYQCTESIITYYAPSQLYISFFLTFLYPLSIFLSIYIYKYYNKDSYLYKFVYMVYPYQILMSLRKDNNNISNTNTINDNNNETKNDINDNKISEFNNNNNQLIMNDVIYNASLDIVYYLSMIGSLLTFGVVFPLLSIPICLAIISLYYTSKYICDNFLIEIIMASNEIKKQQQPQQKQQQQEKQLLVLYLKFINYECHGIITKSIIKHAFWIIITSCSCFYSVFLFDILADKNGYTNSFWIIIVTCLIPFYLYIGEFIYIKIYNFIFQQINNNNNSNNNNNNDNNENNGDDHKNDDIADNTYHNNDADDVRKEINVDSIELSFTQSPFITNTNMKLLKK